MTERAIRILIVDDQELMRRGLAMLLGTVDDVVVVGEASHGEEALNAVGHALPDVVLTDARMPVMDGLEFTAECARLHPELPVIILTTFDDAPVVKGALNAGAAGFLLKDSSTEDLVAAVRAALAGGLTIDPRVARAAVGLSVDGDPSVDRAIGDPHQKLGRDQKLGGDRKGPVEIAHLTPTEQRVAAFISQGMNNQEIAGTLFLAEGTVKNHVSAIMRKLQVHDRTRLALMLSQIDFSSNINPATK